jgi:MFS family permease
MPVERSARPALPRALVAGLAGALACLVAAAIPQTGQAALRGWLAALALVGSAAAGALVLVAIMRLVPGAWERVFSIPAARLSIAGLLLPFLAIPVLVGAPLVFPAAEDTGWHAPMFVAARSIALLVLLGVLGALLPRRHSPALACVVLLLVPCFVTVLADDGLLSRDPGTESSGFGLYVLSLGMMTAAAVGLLVCDLERLSQKATTAAGGVLLTMVLLSAYFAFMPFIIVWSGNRPEQVLWYAERAGPWSTLLWTWTLVQAVALMALMMAPILSSARALQVLAAVVLVAALLQWGWLVLPAGGQQPQVADCAFWLLATASLCALGMGVARLLMPRETTSEVQP